MAYVYKPSTRKGAVFLAPTDKGPPTITGPDGTVYRGVPANQRGGVFYGHEGYQYVFDNDVIGLQGAKIQYGDEVGTIANGAQDWRGDSLQNWVSTGKGSIGDPSSMGFTGSNLGAYGMLPNPSMINFEPINYKPIKYKPIDYTGINYEGITAAPFTFTDPLQAANRYNEFNTQAEGQAYEKSLQRGQELTNLDTQAITGFAGQMSSLQKSLVDSENKFNQAQRLQAVDFAMPDLRSSLDAKKGRADTYASGRLLSSAEDRAYEVAARSASADGSFTRGFGDDSVFGRRTSDVLSAQQRLGISQMGEGLVNDWISQGSSLLIDSPLKTSISQGLPSTPPILPSQQASQQQTNLTNLTTVPLQFGISSEINQQEFGTNLEQGTRTFNASNTFAKDQYNASNVFAKDQFNASNRFAQQQFNAGNRLAKDQFNASGGFAASQAQFAGLQSNYSLATQASQRAEDIQRQQAQNEAASKAADLNIADNKEAGSVSAGAQIGGAVGTVGGAIAGNAIGGPVGGAIGAAIGGSIGSTIGGSIGSLFSGSSGGGEVLSSVMGSAPAQAPSQQAPQAVVTQSPSQVTRSASIPTTYNGAAIPVQSGPMDAGATAQQVSSGYVATGSLANDVGRSGVQTPQLSQLGRSLQVGAGAANSITTQYQAVATPEARMSLAGSLQSAAISNAPSPEAQESVNQIFSQVKEHLDTGVGVTGQAAGIAGFIQNYDKYSGPERARAITNISFAGQDLKNNYGVDDLTSESIGAVSVPGTNGKLTLKDTISLATSGYNVSSLVKNWDDISEVHSEINGNDTLLSIASTARNLGLLGTETPEVVEQKRLELNQNGAQPAGAWGISAVVLPQNGKRILGMADMGRLPTGQVVSIPQELIASSGVSQGVIGSGTIGPSVQADLAVGEGAANIYNTWSTDFIPKDQQTMGATPSVAAGLYRMGGKDPFLLGSILLNGNIDPLQELSPEAAASLEERGLFDREAESGPKLEIPNDDLHRASLLPAQAFAAILTGGLDGDVPRQTAGFMSAKATNGPERNFNPDTFKAVQGNFRTYFDRAGIKTKGESYALSNQLFHEGRVSQTQLVKIQQGINLVFDEQGYKAASQLLEGWKLGGRNGQNA